MTKLFSITILMLGLLIYADESKVTRKCADFVAISADDNLFNLALGKHKILRKSLKGGVAQLDPNKILPIWNDTHQSSFGYDFDASLLVFCWFAPQMKAGVFYFEGYTASEAQTFVKGFQMDFIKATPLDGALMSDGILNYEKLFETFPRLLQSFTTKVFDSSSVGVPSGATSSPAKP